MIKTTIIVLFCMSGCALTPSEPKIFDVIHPNHSYHRIFLPPCNLAKREVQVCDNDF
jgi:hypothetical protein